MAVVVNIFFLTFFPGFFLLRNILVKMLIYTHTYTPTEEAYIHPLTKREEEEEQKRINWVERISISIASNT